MKPIRKLSQKLDHEVDLQIPGFEVAVSGGTLRQLSFDSRSSHQWFSQFERAVFAAINTRHLPVYRMADGEFQFCVGPRKAVTQAKTPAGWLAPVVKLAAAQVRLHLRRQALDTCWGESYTVRERREALPHFLTCLRQISEHGRLAMNFVRAPDRFAEEYYEPMCNWFDLHGIPLSPENYIPFYFVYALLARATLTGLFDDKKILVLTHLTVDRRAAIAHTLEALGAKEVGFIPISNSKSLFDQVQIPSSQPDLVLIGAGVGSANILYETRLLATPCIDAGFYIDCLANPALRGKRFFTQVDSVR